MVCLPLSDTGAPLERLAGWRLVLFVMFEFALCIVFSSHPPPDTPQLRPTPRPAQNLEAIEELEFMHSFPLYRQPNWVQDLLPALSAKAFVRGGKGSEPHAELLDIPEWQDGDAIRNSGPPCGLCRKTTGSLRTMFSLECI